MIDSLIELDKEAFLLLNGLHSPWLDGLMVYFSWTITWIPLYATLLYFIIRASGKNAWIVLLGVAVTLLFADQLTSGLMKPWFSRLRPTWEPQLAPMVHIVDEYRGGRFGFASSHAANTFGTVVFLLLTYRKKWMLLLFVWPIAVSYSRIYLGVHYPGDVIAGGLAGALCGWIAFTICNIISRYVEKRKTPST